MNQIISNGIELIYFGKVFILTIIGRNYVCTHRPNLFQLLLIKLLALCAIFVGNVHAVNFQQIGQQSQCYANHVSCRVFYISKGKRA